MSKATAIWTRNVNIRWVENNTLGSSCETNEPTAGHVDFTVVSQGTSSDFGGNSFLPNWSVGSRQIHVNMGIFVLAYYATFVGTFPAEDPQVTILVSIDEPNAESNDRFGGTASAPLFAELAQIAISELQVKPPSVAAAEPA